MPKEKNTILTVSQAPAPSPAKQIKWLMSELAGNGAFAECRGRLKVPFEDILDGCTNPSSTLKVYDKAIAVRRIMVNLLARLKRCGWKVAYDELWEALNHRGFLFTGETVPVEQTVDGYLLIVDLDITLMFVRWLYSTSYPKDIVPYLKGEVGRPDRAMYGRLTKQVFERFPCVAAELVERVKHEATFSCVFVNPPIKFFSQEIIVPFWNELEKKILDRPRHRRNCLGADKASQDGQWQRAGSVAMFVTEIGIQELLGCFSRSQQKRLTVWRFSVPRVELDNLGCFPVGTGMRIGLHPADQHHKIWSKHHPSYVSRNVTHGLGAILLPQDMVGDDHWRVSRMKDVVPMYTALGLDCASGAACEVPQEDMEKQRILLSFPHT